MGIFTSNSHYSLSGVEDYASQIPANEDYNAITGYAMAMLEVQENDMSLFNHAILGDFQEVSAMNEGYQVINESAKTILDKIIEIFKKLIGKIKGIFQAFMAKFGTALKDNSKLYTKYNKRISNCSKWDKFKVNKVRLPREDTPVKEAIEKVFKYEIAEVNDYDTSSSDCFGIDWGEISKKEADVLRKAVLNKRLDGNKIDGNLKNMEEKMMSEVFKDPEDIDKWTAASIEGRLAGDILKEADKWIKTVKEQNNNLTGGINKIIGKLKELKDKADDAYTNDKIMKDTKLTIKTGGNGKYIVTADDSDNATEYQGKYGIKNTDYENEKKKLDDYNNMSDSQKTDYRNKHSGNPPKEPSEYKADTSASILRDRIAALQTMAGHEQTVITRYIKVYTDVVKFAVGQARKIWTSAAAYASMKNESYDYEYYTAVGESVEYDFISDMEAVEY